MLNNFGAIITTLLDGLAISVTMIIFLSLLALIYYGVKKIFKKNLPILRFKNLLYSFMIAEFILVCALGVIFIFNLFGKFTESGICGVVTIVLFLIAMFIFFIVSILPSQVDKFNQDYEKDNYNKKINKLVKLIKSKYGNKITKLANEYTYYSIYYYDNSEYAKRKMDLDKTYDFYNNPNTFNDELKQLFIDTYNKLQKVCRYSDDDINTLKMFNLTPSSIESLSDCDPDYLLDQISSLLGNSYHILYDEFSSFNNVILRECFSNTAVITYNGNHEIMFNQFKLDCVKYTPIGDSFEEIKNFRNKISDYMVNIKDEYDKNKGIIMNGVQGEQAVEEILDLYDDEIKYLKNVRLEDKISVENDFIILSDKGIYSLEVKNFGKSGSYSLEISRDGQWKKIIDDKATPMKDVGTQVNNHIVFTEKIINKRLKEMGFSEKIEIEPIIVIANDNVIIDNLSDLTIVRTSQIYPIIKKGTKKYSKKLLNAIEEILKSEKKSIKEYDDVDYTKSISEFVDWCISQTDNYYKNLDNVYDFNSKFEKMVKTKL